MSANQQTRYALCKVVYSIETTRNIMQQFHQDSPCLLFTHSSKNRQKSQRVLHLQFQQQWENNDGHWRCSHCRWCHPRLQHQTNRFEHTCKHIKSVLTAQLPQPALQQTNWRRPVSLDSSNADLIFKKSAKHFVSKNTKISCTVFFACWHTEYDCQVSWESEKN